VISAGVLQAVSNISKIPTAFIYPEDGSDKFLQNAGNSYNSTHETEILIFTFVKTNLSVKCSY
jgi:hypothetical protein